MASHGMKLVLVDLVVTVREVASAVVIDGIRLGPERGGWVMQHCATEPVAPETNSVDTIVLADPESGAGRNFNEVLVEGTVLIHVDVPLKEIILSEDFLQTAVRNRQAAVKATFFVPDVLIRYGIVGLDELRPFSFTSRGSTQADRR